MTTNQLIAGKSICTIILVGCCLMVAAWILWMLAVNLKHQQEPNSQNWGKWGSPKVTSDQWNGTTIWQMRTNTDTGEVELRGQTASPHGGYNSQ